MLEKYLCKIFICTDNWIKSIIILFTMKNPMYIKKSASGSHPSPSTPPMDFK